MIYVIVFAVVVVFAVGLALLLRSRGSGDGVDSFRRQIDALSPEARRPTVNKVKSAERDAESGTGSDDRSNDREDGTSGET